MHGIVLTQTDNLSNFLGALRSNHIPMLKVITGWGYHWDQGTIAQVCSGVPGVIVRTVSGDGCRPPAEGQDKIFLDPSDVIAELSPWLEARAGLWVELGNEPNMYDDSDDAAWTFQWWFAETVRQLRDTYPTARIIAPGLCSKRWDVWWNICHAERAFDMADAVGFHAYAWRHLDDPADNGGELMAALSLLGTYYPSRPWIGTEIGINDPPTPPSTKCDRYYAAHQKLPSQVSAMYYYAYTDHPSDPDQQAYQLPSSAWPHLKAGGTL
jgi:hypothetical protein